MWVTVCSVMLDIRSEAAEMSLDLSSHYLHFKVGMAKAWKHGGYAFGEFRLDPEKRMLYRGDAEVSLPPKVIETLIVLVENQGEIVSKADLMEKVWADSIVEESNLSQHLYLLRRTLGEAGEGRPVIETLRRRGYRFSAEVRLIDHPFRDTTRLQPVQVAKSNNIYSVVDWQSGPEIQTQETNERKGRTDQPIKSTPRRSPVIVAVCALGVFVFLGVYAVSTWQKPNGIAGPSAPELNISRLTTAGKTKRAAISPDGNYIAHVTEYPDGNSLWVRQVAETADVRIAGPAATEYVWITFAADGNSVFYLALDRDKGETELYRVPVLGGPSRIAARDVGPVGFSPDGSRMAFIRNNQGESLLIVSDADGMNEVAVGVKQQPEHFLQSWNAPAWSPDGKTIACPVSLSDDLGKFETVVGIDTETGSERRLISARLYNVGQPKWLRNGLLVTASEIRTDPRQIWHISAEDGAATRITRDLNNYYDLSTTADAGRVSAVQVNALSNVLVAPKGDEAQTRQIASEVGWIGKVAWTPDGRIVFRSNAGDGTELWIINADGTNLRQLTVGARAGPGLDVTPDGRYVVFASDRGGRFNIWRVGVDGANFTQLTTGDGDTDPDCTPDGKWVFYQTGETDPSLATVSIDGGEPVSYSGVKALRPDVSPDGSRVAYHYLDSALERSRWSIGIVSLASGAREDRFDLPPTAVQRFVRWSPDGGSIVYANELGGVSDLWLQPIGGGSPRQLTNFRSDSILAFDWSTDGQSLVLVRNVEMSDVVLIRHKLK